MNAHSPRVSPMTRVLLVVLLCALAAGCSRGPGSEPGGPRDAETFKVEMDAFARDTLPKLRSSIGGEWSFFPARFYEKGGNTGSWEYTASAGASRPSGTAKEVLAKIEVVLRRQGMDVTRPRVVSDIAARKGNISVLVELGLEPDEESVSSLVVDFSSFDRLTSHDDFAENAPPEDYLADLE